MLLTLVDAELYGPRLRLTLMAEERARGVDLALPSTVAWVVWNRPTDPVAPFALSARAMKPYREDSFRIIIPLPPASHALHGLSLVSASPDILLAFANGLDRRLANIFPCDDDAYVEMFQSNTRRWGNVRTRFFLAEQISRFFTGAPEHSIGAALIMAYKAVEVGNTRDMLRALKVNSSAFELLATLGPSSHPRCNPEHLEISLLTTRWHLQAALGDLHGTRLTLQQLLARTRVRASYWTLAYSASKSLLLAGWLEWRLGEVEQARACWERCVALFRLAAAEADPRRSVLFAELSHSLAAAQAAGRCLAALTMPTQHVMPSLGDIIGLATRVRLAARERIQQALEMGVSAFE
ncbi:hypothetical protein [Roseomonas sp. WA12]